MIPTTTKRAMSMAACPPPTPPRRMAAAASLRASSALGLLVSLQAGASLACPADDDTLTAIAADFLSTRGIKLWIGVYQGLGAAEPLGGWDKCTMVPI